MKILTKSRAFAVVHIPLATAALLGICAADELQGEKTVATGAVPATSDAAANGLHCAAGPASTGAVLVGPDGHEFRLAYVPGYGCRYVVGGKSAVILDGPNGYAFTWTRETGWKILSTAD
jgi:hypothetical protein